MKKLITALTMLLILLVSTGAAGEQETDTSDKSVIKEIYRVYREGKFAKVLEMTEKAMASLGHNLDLIHAKYDALIKLRRFDDALGFIDEMIKKKGASEELVSAKYNVFMLQENFPEALKAAIQKDKIAKKKSPWDTINIMNVYLAMGSKEEALDTLQEAADRGFISYRILTGEQYELLEKEKRFYEIIETMKVTVGLGKQAKNFQVKLLSGEFFNLYRQKGKVILIDFWATWCDACIRDKRGLKQTYDFFKDKGFDILSISLDTNEDRLKELVKRFKMDWKHAVSGKGWDDPTVKRYGINSLPSYWLIDKNSVLRAFDLKGKSLQNAIIDLLKE